MKKGINRICFVLCLFAFSGEGYALALSDSLAEPVRPNQVRVPDQILQDEIFSDSDYLYDKAGKPPVSWLERFFDWLDSLFDDMMSTTTGEFVILVVKWILVAALIFLVIWLLVKNDVRSLFYRKGRTARLEFSEFSEDIHAIDYEKEIAAAVSAGDFRRAVRLYFLRILKNLADKQLIDWKQDKTNYEFYMELKRPEIRSEFRTVSILYDYIWYGDFKIGEKEYGTALEKFRSFNKHLQN